MALKRKEGRGRSAWLCLALVSSVALASGVAAADGRVKAGNAAVNPKLWPKAMSPFGVDKAVEARITRMLSQMSVEEKVGQVIQPEWKAIKPEEVTQYHIGSIGNGGGSVPGGNKHATVQDWVDLIEPYYQASVVPGKKVTIPLIYASDAVHGHNNVYGATLFPHNIGLGAARDPDLLRRIGEVTAAEVRSTGMDWTFAPTIAVARDDRWGRTYESYSEDPRIASQYAAAMVAGIQGTGSDFLGPNHVIATAKHFLGDGATDGGRDQGDSTVSESELARLHGSPYVDAINTGTQSVMASFNSWHGVKLHANKGLLTDVLKGRMGFDGFIMGDWLAHGQIPGCTNSDCPQAFNAGLDIYNQPQDWKALHGNLVQQVKSGVIPMARLDDAVRRILRVKFRMGAFDAPSPAKRATTLKPIGTPLHRAVAREAVRKSLVLLKNNDVLPIRPSATVLVAGTGADNIAMQSGGWTLSWQGADNGPNDFPGATSIYEGLKAQIEAAGGQAWLSPDGSSPQKPDVAIVVFGEEPYAEFMGDQADVALQHKSAQSLELIRKLKSQGIPVVAVMMSGRPLYVNPHINGADAFVAAWLPGSEGAGIADVLLAKVDGSPQYDFHGRLSFSWPRRPDQTPLNVGDTGYDPQFAYGFGLTYASPRVTPALVEVADTTRYGEKNVYYTKGEAWNGYKLWIGDSNAPRMDYVGTRTTLYGTAALMVEPQGDGALHLVWNGKSLAWVEMGADKPSDIAREANGAMLLSLSVRVNSVPSGDVRLGVGRATVPITGVLKDLPAGSYATVAVPLSCFKTQDLAATPTIMRMETNGTLDVSIADIRLTETKSGAECPAK
ncbi:glycoside hydrolase family 3 protein [Asticcacaulis sp. AC402]|uniref:glycoside hydrolase family 3 protein n=1 Tax=Asticcacaulis sp. AC402 TaxID=1282361 RepID=UPI0003C40A39|nr:glycoside hydrolase family 3 protein [Asticcacaulis sp. AC402]ESQ76631.1 1,4-beta-D-glucan glucohydrolase [Asticcacaulis sp. AC402]